MTFPSYLVYKESGVEWQGAVPVEWPRSALKYLADYQNGYPFKPEDWCEEGLPIIRISQLTGDTTPNYYSGELDCRVKVGEGDLLFSWSATIDSFIWTGGAAWLNQHIFKVSPTVEADQKFLFYLIKLVAPKLAEFDAHGSTMRHIKKESLSERLHVPTLVEQTQIARFLDHETARIDVLIYEQQRLIELLKEKRQAVISHAVTKGLDPTVPMKDSGVEWLGEVPHNWKVIKFGITHEKAELGGNYEAGESEDGLPLIKMGNIGRGKIKLDKVECVSIDQNVDLAHTLKEGDFLFNTRNSLDLVGKVCVWRGELASALYNSNILRISFKNNLVGSSGFVNYLFNSDLGLEQLRLIARGTTSVAAIYYKDLSSLSFAFPPPSEQREIEGFLDIKTSQLDDLVNVAEQTIVLIKERRSALISAAVTGKIDVRGWRPPASTQAAETAVAEAV